MFKIRKLMLLSILLFSFNSIFGYKLVGLNSGSNNVNFKVAGETDYEIKPNFGSFLHLDIVKPEVKFSYKRFGGKSVTIKKNIGLDFYKLESNDTLFIWFADSGLKMIIGSYNLKAKSGFVKVFESEENPVGLLQKIISVPKLKVKFDAKGEYKDSTDFILWVMKNKFESRLKSLRKNIFVLTEKLKNIMDYSLDKFIPGYKKNIDDCIRESEALINNINLFIVNFDAIIKNIKENSKPLKTY